MFRNCLLAAFRSLARSRFYSAISILGLAVGLTSAILVGLVIHDQLSHDRFISGYDRTYLAVSVLTPQGRPSDYNPGTHSGVAALFKLRFAELDAVTRLAEQDVLLRKGQLEVKEKIYWADPNAFDVLPIPVIAGDLTHALQRPDNIVITRSIARKYFGRDEPIGETIELDRQHSMSVAAVIEDLPPHGTQFESGIFASGRASYSQLTELDRDPSNAIGQSSFGISVRTYVRTAPHASIERVQAAMPDLMRGIWPQRPPGLGASMQFVRLDKVHVFAGLNPGIAGRLSITAMIGALILFIACVNFINLSTARSARRAKEVGIRKVSGASRRALMLQFLGEALVYVCLATVIALVLTRLALPYVNAFLDSAAALDHRGRPALFLWIAAGALAVALLAGAYPAVVLSAFRPIAVMKGRETGSLHANLTRQTLVTLQFAILIGLLIATAVVYRQRAFATHAAVLVETDDVLVIESPCDGAFRTELESMPGVLHVACTGKSFLRGGRFANITLRDGRPLAIDDIPVEPGVFDAYLLEPQAGEWSSHADATGQSDRPAPYAVINETAVHALGFASSSAAIGQLVTLPPSKRDGESSDVRITAVVRDFSLSSVEQRIKPTLYEISGGGYGLIHMKLQRAHIGETLAAVDQLWTRMGNVEPIRRYFLSEHIENLYRDILREAQAFGVFSCVAILLACLGMVGLSASTMERRSKEIGVRKALGAGTGEIMQLLIWQFSKPVLLANLIAWPAAAIAMSRWLNGFAYHVELEGWLFVTAAMAALLVATLTVSINCYLVARAKPTDALRYE
jgi:putative ABC transport system permease protein